MKKVKNTRDVIIDSSIEAFQLAFFWAILRFVTQPIRTWIEPNYQTDYSLSTIGFTLVFGILFGVLLAIPLIIWRLFIRPIFKKK